MVSVIFVRHGLTKTSADADLIEGWSETVLTKEGCLQAQKTFLQIREHHRVDAIKSSRLPRAKETAAIGEAILNVPLEFTTLLVERNFGLLEGRRWSEVMAEHGPEIRERDKNSTYDYRPWKGDSAADMQKRLDLLKAWLK